MKLIKQLTWTDYLKKENDVELDPRVVLWGDSRWESTIEQFEQCRIFGLDVETYGAKEYSALYFREAYIRLISLSLSEDLCLILDLGGWQDSREERLARYKNILKLFGRKLFDRSCIKLGVNLKFDIVMLQAHFGFRTRQVRDLMITSQVLWAGLGVEKAKAGEARSERCKISHGMKGVAERLDLGHLIDKSEQTSDWGWELTNAQFNYSGSDSLILHPMYDRIKPLVISQGIIYSAMAENDCVPVFAEMEYYGCPVDLEYTERIKQEYLEAQEECLKPFFSTFPDINWLSNDQVLQAFNEKWPHLNLESVGAEIIGNLNLPEANALILARSMNTSINYLDGVLRKAFKYKEEELVSVRTFYRQIAPSGSGRSSCNGKLSRKAESEVGVQLQNPPAKPPLDTLTNVLDIFRVPDGYAFGVFDLSAAHARIAAQLSQDKMLLDIYNQDFDGHSILAADISKFAWEEFFRLDPLGQEVPQTLQDLVTEQEFKYWEPDDIRSRKKKGYARKLRDLSKTGLYSCVPTTTQCLTREGWKYHNEVEVGTEILAYDINKKLNVWTPILEKFYYEDAPVIEWRVGKHKVFKSTPNHRWFGKKRVRTKTKCETSFKYYQDIWFTTETKNTECIILNAALAEPGPGIFLKDYVSEHTQDSEWIKLVLEMNEQERWLFFSANIATDGCQIRDRIDANYIRAFNFTQDVTKQPGLFEAMHLCGYLLGFNVNLLKSNPSNNTKCRVLRFDPRITTTCQKPQMKETHLENQPVWCVRTGLDTWVVKEENYITITGNSLNGSTAGRFFIAALGAGFDWFTLEIAKKTIDKFSEYYSGLVKFIRTNNKQVNSTAFFFNHLKDINGHPLDGEWGMNRTLTGRTIYFKKYPCRAEWKKGQLEVSYTDNVSSNWLMAEADIMKRWGADCLEQFDLHPEWQAKIVVNKHDQLNFTCIESYSKIVAVSIYSCLEKVMSKWLTSLPFDEEGFTPENAFKKSEYEAK